MTGLHPFAAAARHAVDEPTFRRKTTKIERIVDDVMVRRDYQNILQLSFAAKDSCVALQEEWNLFRSSLMEAAKEACGVRRPAVMQQKAAS